eukprot:10175560-Ditylum_brightwellii.AAC.1
MTEDGPQYEYHTASNTAAFVTFLKALFGAGLLAQPSILGEVGLTLGIVAFIVIAVGCTFACYVLLQARSLAQHIQEAKDKESGMKNGQNNLVTYGDLARTLLGNKMAIITTFTIVTIHVFFASGMVNVAVTNLATFFEWDEGEKEEVAHRALSCILLPIIVLLLQIPRLADLFFISAAGLIVYMVGCIGSLLYAVFRAKERHTPEDMWETNWEGIPYFVASTVYAIEGINLALPTVNSMEDTSKAVPVVCFGVMSYGLMSLSIAVFGYINGIGGGDDRHDPEECRDVSYCLSSENLRNIHIVSLAIALICTLPVILYPSTEMLEIFFFNQRKQKKRLKEEKLAKLRGEDIGTEMVIVDGSNFNPLLEVMSIDDDDIRWREEIEKIGTEEDTHSLHPCDNTFNPVIEMMMEEEFPKRLEKRQLEMSDDSFWHTSEMQSTQSKNISQSYSGHGHLCEDLEAPNIRRAMPYCFSQKDSTNSVSRPQDEETAVQ